MTPNAKRRKAPFFAVLMAAASLLAGCGPSPEVDTEFTPYVRKFEDEAGFPVTSDVVFRELDGFRGYCYPKGEDGRKQIWIDPESWREMASDEAAKELLMFHELGHCELSRPHDNTRGDDGDYVSIMNGAGVTSFVDEYVQNRAKYLNELFNR
ncbi:MAG: hypothetical protein IT285_05725 [Bdellovibrionales bacterium]|nr:hypothetical protein [Bdellovibrionales bacterium]